MSTENEISLSSLCPAPGSRRRRKRLGKGDGSGLGKTCGKGQKGQNSRSGSKHYAGFEGGQMPLYRRLPKRGFTSRKKIAGKNVFSLVSLDQLSALEGVDVVTVDVLKASGLVRASAPRVKILNNGSLSKKLTIEVHAASASAKSAIEAAGGELKILS
jgi:large subunit ribosomal protein L15